MSTHPPRRDTALWIATALLGAAAIVLVGGFALGMAFGGMGMGSMMGSGRPEQTPVVLQGADVAIDIQDFDYFPRYAAVDAGTTVTWTNYDSAPHSATDRQKAWDTGLLQEDESRAITFDTPGTFEYYCTVHPNMTATLTVR